MESQLVQISGVNIHTSTQFVRGHGYTSPVPLLLCELFHRYLRNIFVFRLPLIRATSSIFKLKPTNIHFM